MKTGEKNAKKKKKCGELQKRKDFFFSSSLTTLPQAESKRSHLRNMNH
jgi:hypothetical protein